MRVQKAARVHRLWSSSLGRVAEALLVACAISSGFLLLQAVVARRAFDLGWMLERLSAEAVPFIYLVMASTVVLAFIAIRHGRVRAELMKRSLTDPLTGVRNRRCFDERLHEEQARAERNGQALSLLLLDLDGLKRTNDTAGHRMGDRVLTRFAQALVRAARTSDVIFRLGGDEFAILAPSTPSALAMHLAARIRGLTERAPAPFAPDALHASVGVADLASVRANDELGLFDAADAALYDAKRSGGNRATRFPAAPLPPPPSPKGIESGPGRRVAS